MASEPEKKGALRSPKGRFRAERNNSMGEVGGAGGGWGVGTLTPWDQSAGLPLGEYSTSVSNHLCVLYLIQGQIHASLSKRDA